MDFIIKKASALTEEEKGSKGLTDIPSDWPIESYPFSGSVPSGFEQISEEDLNTLKTSNQAAYDAWVASRYIQDSKIIKIISPRQLRLALLSQGATEQMVLDYIAQLSEPTKSQTLIGWNHATEFDLDNPQIQSMGTSFGFTSEQLEAIWQIGATL